MFLLPDTSAMMSVVSMDYGSRALAASGTHRQWHRPLIGPEVSVFLPISSSTRDLFGPSWSSFTFGIGAVEQASPGGSFSFDIEVLSSERYHNHAFVVPIGIDFRIGSAVSPSRPSLYCGAGVNLVPANIRILSRGIPPGIGVAGGASIFVGLTVGKRGYLEARYRAISGLRSINFSGTGLSGGIRF